jgi:hypothetical protein
VVGDPLTFGLNQFAIGVRLDIPREVVDTFNYWMNELMTCSPSDNTCDSFAGIYEGGTGYECGYVQFPSSNTFRLSNGIIAGIVTGVISLIIAGMSGVYYRRLKKQRKRYKKRFVQQIARNIAIGPSPGCISADKLAQEVGHIGREKGVISKQDLWLWMNDIKLTFLSDSDFQALWNAIDIERRGLVDPVEFIVFLSMCGSEFKEVFQEIQGFSKTEKLKWAARRLTNFAGGGEENVRRIENKVERASRAPT